MRTRGKLRPLRGEVRVPGDKSISHRALLFAGLAAGRSTVRGINTGGDVAALPHILTSLGARCSLGSKDQVHVEGCGWEGLAEPDAILDVGNSGTLMRLLPAICAGIDGLSVLTGDRSVRSRPMLRVVEPLRRMGATIDGRSGADRPPLAVRGGPLAGIGFSSPVPSAQVKSAVLIAGLRAEGETSVQEPLPSRDHTERMLSARGVALFRSADTVSVLGPSDLMPLDQEVPGDLSSAMFLIVAALLIPGSDLTIRGVGLNPTRTGALDVLRAMGASIDAVVEAESGGEPHGTVVVRSSELHGVQVGPDQIPGLIDEIPALAVAAAAAEGETEIAGARELRVKESDRISALAETLGSLGADIRERPDGLLIKGPSSLRGGAVDSRGDHRIAMALAVAGLISTDTVTVGGWKSVDTSFPEFMDVIGAVQDRE